VEDLIKGTRACHQAKRLVIAVHRRRPRRDRIAYARLNHRRIEAGVGDSELLQSQPCRL